MLSVRTEGATVWQEIGEMRIGILSPEPRTLWELNIYRLQKWMWILLCHNSSFPKTTDGTPAHQMKWRENSVWYYFSKRKSHIPFTKFVCGLTFVEILDFIEKWKNTGFPIKLYFHKIKYEWLLWVLTLYNKANYTV